MADRPDPSQLQKQWLHSHEEDTPGRTVYRPADYHFPPSRGRKGFDLGPGGNLVEIGIGPTDRSTRTLGKWRLVGDKTLEFTRASMAAAAAPAAAAIVPHRRMRRPAASPLERRAAVRTSRDALTVNDEELLWSKQRGPQDQTPVTPRLIDESETGPRPLEAGLASMWLDARTLTLRRPASPQSGDASLAPSLNMPSNRSVRFHLSLPYPQAGQWGPQRPRRRPRRHRWSNPRGTRSSRAGTPRSLAYRSRPVQPLLPGATWLDLPPKTLRPYRPTDGPWWPLDHGQNCDINGLISRDRVQGVLGSL